MTDTANDVDTTSDDARQGGGVPRCPVCEDRGIERPLRDTDYPYECEDSDCRVYSYRGERDE